ncbi:MAG: restriction endonuclease subunit S [Opitutaceae bacterium]|nr:restriction endonuclease subunit S [Opitutaceae bacterium]
MNFATASLAEIAEVAAGGGAPQNADDFTVEGTPFIRAGSLSPLVNGASESTLEHLTDEVAKEHGLRKFPCNTVVFAKSGMSATKGHVYRLRNEAYVVNHLAAIIPTDRVVPEFLEHSLRVFSPVRLIQDAAYPSVRLSDVATMKIPLPPLAEQRRIAEVLDRAEALRAKRRAALAHLDTLTQSLFLDLFGDPATNPKGFPKRPLASLVRDDDTINYGVVQPGDDLEEGIPLVRVGDLVDGKVRHSELKRIAPSIEAAYKRSRLRGDEILVSCVGSIGVVALADDSVKGFNIARAVARIPLAETTDRIFMAAYLSTDFVQRYFTNELRTVSQPTLNIKQISEATVVLPPIAQQREFTRRVTAVEQLKTAQRVSLAELDALFATLQHRAFRGEL